VIVEGLIDRQSVYAEHHGALYSQSNLLSALFSIRCTVHCILDVFYD
jgi:hypothetical protein